MLKSQFDRVMEKRSTKLIRAIGDWLPQRGTILDVGSGTGHLAERLEQELGVEVVPADVSDMHVMGRTPILISDGELPFPNGTHAAALLIFMLHYPVNPVALLVEAARVTQGPVIVVQSLYSGTFGYLWLRVREFVWTYVAFHISKAIGYVPQGAMFSMSARRFYSFDTFGAHVKAAGLDVCERRESAVLPGGALVVGAWRLERVPAGRCVEGEL